MHKLKEFYITVDRREENDAYTDLRVWLKATVRDEHSRGMKFISFLLIDDEWEQLFTLGGDFSDISHKLSTFGESWTFYDLPFPSEDCGRMEVPYVRIIVPKDVRAFIRQEIHEAIAEYDAKVEGLERPDWNIKSVKLDYTGNLAVWSENYGQGKGTVKVQAYDEVRALLDQLYESKDPSFVRSWDTILNLARNTTHKREDVGFVHVHRESETVFLWSAGGLHGGLVNHGTDDDPDWSTHT